MEKKTILALFTIIAFSFISIQSLFNRGLPPTHDGEYHIVRFAQFYKTFINGDIYPRWAPDLNKGYGIPIFNFVYPLPNYVAVLLHTLSLSFIDSLKYNFIIATFVGSIFFFLWIKNLFGRTSAVVASIFLILAPYRLLDIYIRGSVGEIWAIALLPGFLWAINNIRAKSSAKYITLGGTLFALIIFSHNILSMLYFPFICSYIVFLRQTNKRAYNSKLILPLCIGLLLSAVFWLPAIFEKQHTRGLDVFSSSRHFPELYQLIIPSWGSGFSGGSLSQNMSFQIGVANLLVTFICLVLFFRKKMKEKTGIYLFFLGWFVFAVFLLLKQSDVIWRLIPFLSFAQFPWRYLSLIIVCCAFFAGAIVYIVKRKIIISFFLVSILLLTTHEYIKPAYFHDRDDSYYLTRTNFIDGTNSPGDIFNTIWMNSKMAKVDKKLLFSSPVTIREQTYAPTKYQLTVYAPQKTEMTINTAYFPGWKARINDVDSPLQRTKDGLIRVSIPENISYVSVYFTDTIVRVVAKFLSIVGIGVIILVILLEKRKKNHEDSS